MRLVINSNQEFFMKIRVLGVLAGSLLSVSSVVFAAEPTVPSATPSPAAQVTLNSPQVAQVDPAKTGDLTLTLKEHRFTPDTLTIPADTKVKITIVNNDAQSEEFESSKLGREKVIAGKTKGVVLVGPLKAGEYPFVGEFHEDTAKGKIVVQEKEVKK